MSFLDKAKQQVSNRAGIKDKKNPIGNPFKKSESKVAPKSEVAKETSLPKAPGKLPGKMPGNLPKPNGLPGNLPKPGHLPTSKLGTKVENIVEKEKVAEEKLEKTIPVKEEIKEVKEVKEVQEVKETPVAQEIKEETIVEEKETVVKEEPKKEVKENTKRSSKKKGSKKNAAKEESVKEATETFNPEAFPTTEMPFAECISAIRTNFVDPEWEKYKETIQKDYTDIIIPSDANRMQLEDLISQLSALKDRIQFVFTDIKTNFELLVSKDDGLIDQVKRMNATGSNAEERKINATKAVMSHNGINLYELSEELKSRYNFMKLIMDSIEFKKGVLLTMLSARKGDK